MNALYEGWVGHRRVQPVEHAFRYPVRMAYLELDAIPARVGPAWLWSTARPALVRFTPGDYLTADAARDLAGTRGPVRLLTQLRCLGRLFNPVSVYYCFEGDRVAAVVAEVTNTPWGERHAYVLRGGGDGGSVRDRVDKVFHVSPFMAMDHEYELSLTVPGERLAVDIVSRRGGDVHFDATLRLERRPLDPAGLRRQPAPTLAVLARIYANAVRLKLKGAPYFPHPAR